MTGIRGSWSGELDSDWLKTVILSSDWFIMSNTVFLLVRMVEELGIKCRTVASVHSVRCAAIGPWSADNSLLLKHFSLQNVLNNMSDNRKLYKQSVAKPGNIRRANIVNTSLASHASKL